MKTQQRPQLLESLRTRFEKNMHRHMGLAWTTVLARIEANSAAVTTLDAMESSGGEPDVIGQDRARRSPVVLRSARVPRSAAGVNPN